MNIFISYAHADAGYVEKLHKHLALMRRDGLVKTWHDRQLLPGDQVDSEILAALESSDVFLAIVTPDFLHSKYCYETEFKRAMQRASAGEMRIVAVICEPCDWPNSPLRECLALPTDGKAIAEFANQNNAFLDVTNGLRRLVTSGSKSKPSEVIDRGPAPVRQVRLRREFDAIEKAEFADATYQKVARYFQDSCAELERADENIRTKFELMGDGAFTCAVVNRAASNKTAYITIHRNKRRGGFGEISYDHTHFSEGNQSNGNISISSDEYAMFLSLDAWGGEHPDQERLSAEQVADKLWVDFIGRAGIEYA